MKSLLPTLGLATALLSLGLTSCVTVTIDRPSRGRQAPPPPVAAEQPGIFEEGVAPENRGTPAAPPLDENKKWYRHTIVAGDSLWKISRDYNTTINDIRAANGIEGDRINVGETIAVPTNEPPAGAVEMPKPEPAPALDPTPVTIPALN
ncbi:MAG: LysM peptidoglycan-binding domain-containing protein [Verrucomicrobiota bacterium]